MYFHASTNVPFRALDRTSYMFNRHNTEALHFERSRVNSFRLVVCVHRKLPSPEGIFGEFKKIGFLKGHYYGSTSKYSLEV